ncbi:MAG TPA: LuxR C-terminal-related transcriptional regulator [Bacteroidia bacterium]|jgi:DNA-binding CsgD family transcriptional regulator|nr:LuxR C-terminal-related transcriptional regulator [Bacteroidia bacterium]HMU19986.1 LuxR C-terminal-related transcriptional regulator [Bacteroidia bacterium]
MHKLTKREAEILKLISDGLTDDAIAQKLDLSRNTIRTYRQNLRAKFNVNNSISMIKIARERRLI